MCLLALVPLQANLAADSHGEPKSARCWLFACRIQKWTTILQKTVVRNHILLSKSQHRPPYDRKMDENGRRCWLFAAPEPKQTTPAADAISPACCNQRAILLFITTFTIKRRERQHLQINSQMKLSGGVYTLREYPLAFAGKTIKKTG